MNSQTHPAPLAVITDPVYPQGMIDTVTSYLPYGLKLIPPLPPTEEEKNWKHDKLQAECYQWHIKKYPEDAHRVHANAANSAGGRYGSHNTAIGVRKGRADLQFYHCWYLYLFEFKTGRDTQKPAQKTYQQENERHGARYFLIHSKRYYEQLIDAIHEYTVDIPF